MLQNLFDDIVLWIITVYQFVWFDCSLDPIQLRGEQQCTIGLHLLCLAKVDSDPASGDKCETAEVADESKKGCSALFVEQAEYFRCLYADQLSR